MPGPVSVGGRARLCRDGVGAVATGDEVIDPEIGDHVAAVFLYRPEGVRVPLFVP